MGRGVKARKKLTLSPFKKERLRQFNSGHSWHAQEEEATVDSEVSTPSSCSSTPPSPSPGESSCGDRSVFEGVRFVEMPLLA